MGMNIGASVIVEVSGDHSQITITPVLESRPIRGRYRIEDLIADSAPSAFAGEHHWSKAQGKEVW